MHPPCRAAAWVCREDPSGAGELTGALSSQIASQGFTGHYCLPNPLRWRRKEIMF